MEGAQINEGRHPSRSVRGGTWGRFRRAPTSSSRSCTQRQKPAERAQPGTAFARQPGADRQEPRHTWRGLFGNKG